jgi:hypothetical protein
MFAAPTGRANWRRLTIFEFSAVPAGKGKLEKIFFKIFEYLRLTRRYYFCEKKLRE